MKKIEIEIPEGKEVQWVDDTLKLVDINKPVTERIKTFKDACNELGGIKEVTMITKDKQLLLQDLCARLPYNVIVDYGYNAFDVHNGNYVKHGSKCILKCYLLDIFMSPRQNEKGEYIKPYLRPMSSMTEEEKVEYCDLQYKFLLSSQYPVTDGYALFDWLNAHHFDFRNLLAKGLAIEVTEEFNHYKN